MKDELKIRFSMIIGTPSPGLTLTLSYLELLLVYVHNTAHVCGLRHPTADLR